MCCSEKPGFARIHVFSTSYNNAGLPSITFSGTTRLELPQGHDDANSSVVPLRREQRRIVAEIEKQFTRLEAGVAALRRVQANLKRYRAAVLKAACEGRLVPTEAELDQSQNQGRKI